MSSPIGLIQERRPRASPAFFHDASYRTAVIVQPANHYRALPRAGCMTSISCTRVGTSTTAARPTAGPACPTSTSSTSSTGTRSPRRAALCWSPTPSSRATRHGAISPPSSPTGRASATARSTRVCLSRAFRSRGPTSPTPPKPTTTPSPTTSRSPSSTLRRRLRRQRRARRYSCSATTSRWPEEVTRFSGSSAVPIHVWSRNPALIAPFLARGYVPGLRPARLAPPRGMETLLPDLLADFSTPSPGMEKTDRN